MQPKTILTFCFLSPYLFYWIICHSYLLCYFPPNSPLNPHVFNLAKLLPSFSYLADDGLSDCSSECSDTNHISDFEDQCKSLNFDLSNGSPIDINNFNIVHYNINSILANGRLEQLTDNCRVLNIGVLIIYWVKVGRNDSK